MCSSAVAAVETELAVVSGQINALHGRVVALLAEASALGLHDGPGLHSPGAYAAWQTGATPAHGAALATVVSRREELPVTVAALEAGEISLHQAATIARHAPSWADGEARGFAASMTPAQLARVCSHYPSAERETDAVDDERAAGRFEVRSSPRPDGTWTLRATLPDDEGQLVAAALEAHHNALFAERRDGDPLPVAADALVRMAERSLDAEATARPHQARTKVLVHVDVDAPAGPHARFHLGPALSPAVRRGMTCDATYQAVFEREGRTIGVGRTRTIPTALRVAVEARDDGCRVPGCRRRHVQLHHLHHWEDGGQTETDNLVALCPHHHRAHHRDRLQIVGTDADDSDGVTFTQHGRTLCERPPPEARPGAPPPAAARYDHPTGERLDGWSIDLSEPPPLTTPTHPPG